MTAADFPIKEEEGAGPYFSLDSGGILVLYFPLLTLFLYALIKQCVVRRRHFTKGTSSKLKRPGLVFTPSRPPETEYREKKKIPIDPIRVFIRKKNNK